MADTMITFLVGMGVGTVFPGFWLGRTRAELGRALFDAKRAHTGRNDYRKAS